MRPRSNLLVCLVAVALIAGCTNLDPDPPAAEHGTDPDGGALDPNDPPQADLDGAVEDTGDGELAVDTPAAPAAPATPDASDDADVAAAITPLPTPVRGAWVHLFDDRLKTQAGIEAVVDELVLADANVVFAQVARRHDAYYRSEVLVATPDPGLQPGLDVVDALTRTAHARGLAVHAWIGITPTWHEVYADLDAPAGWLTTTHGRTAPVTDRWVTRTVDGVWTDHLDPALPAVRDHLAAVVTELVATTAVDGIHLDYVRYPDHRHGYHPDALDRFRADTGARGEPAPDDPVWSAWRRDQVRGLVDHLAVAVDTAAQRADREVALTAAVITWGPGPDGVEGGFDGTRTAREALQDWPSWVRDGAVDAVLPMNYFRAHEPDQAAWFDQWLRFEASLAADSDTLVVPGIGGWLNHPDAVFAQVGDAMRAADGAVVYSHQQPTADETRDVWARLAGSGWGTDGGS